MSSPARRGLTAAIILLLLAGGVVGVRALWHAAESTLAANGCTVGRYDLDTGQAAVASTMVGVVAKRRLPERAAVLALGAALQESKLRNLAAGAGDRDSVGVLQQRPSQGWGSAAQLHDIRFATGAFLDALLEVRDWRHLALAEAVQKVQISADGSAYAQHEPEAQALAHALGGAQPAAITCAFAKPTEVATAAIVAAQVARDLPVNTPTASGLRVQVPGASWQTAAWFVANADRLGIETVAYDAKLWSRGKGWRTSSAPATAVIATLYHN